MVVQELMNRDVMKLPLSATFGEAFRMLSEHKIRSLPVVDELGVYRGMFDLYDVWRVLLPKAATLGGDAVRDLAFLPTALEQLREKLREAENRPVREFLDDEKSPSVAAEAPVKEAILLLYRHGGNLPVVDRKSRKLLGIVSAWEILATLR